MTSTHRVRDIAALTAIRGFAAWWVVIYHVRVIFRPYASANVMAFLGKGYLAVDMFFVLSGFVIYLNYVDRIRADRASLADFFVRRFARIYPLHILMWLLTGVFAIAVLIRTGAIGPAYPLKEFFLGIVLMQSWGFSESQTWNVPAWSISTEFAAYLVFPLFLLGLRIRRWGAAGLVAVVLVLIATLHLAFATQGIQKIGAHIATMGIVRCLTQFLMGACLAEIYLRRQHRSEPALAVLLLLAAGGFCLAVLANIMSESLAMPSLWVMLVLGMALWPTTWWSPLRWRPLVYLGDISYGTYLCHYLAFTLFKLFFVTQGEPVAIPAILLFVAAVALASVLLYHWYERPAQRWIMKSWRARLAAAARPGLESREPALPPVPPA